MLKVGSRVKVTPSGLYVEFGTVVELLEKDWVTVKLDHDRRYTNPYNSDRLQLIPRTFRVIMHETKLDMKVAVAEGVEFRDGTFSVKVKNTDTSSYFLSMDQMIRQVEKFLGVTDLEVIFDHE